MNGRDGLEAEDAIRDEAIAWLVRVQSETATAEDWTALTLWLETSEAHLAAFEAAEMMSADIDRHRAQIAEQVTAPSSNVSVFPQRARKPVWAALAAAAAALVAVVAGPGLWRAYQGVPTVYVTRPGETRQLDLADGTHIRMDAASTLTVRLGWRSRRVLMNEAQATFDVAKDAKRPFLIAVGDQQVRVVGTQFNIRHYDGAVRVSVRRGIVEVRQPALGDRPVARLTAGQALNHLEGSAQSTQLAVDPAAAFAWTDNRLVCDNQTLGEIVAYLNRRYAKPITVSPAVAGRRFSGVLELGDEAVVIQQLASYLSLSVRQTSRGADLR